MHLVIKCPLVYHCCMTCAVEYLNTIDAVEVVTSRTIATGCASNKVPKLTSRVILIADRHSHNECSHASRRLQLLSTLDELSFQQHVALVPCMHVVLRLVGNGFIRRPAWAGARSAPS
eukprot:1186721-Prorocentrum_minimum.AAC.2